MLAGFTIDSSRQVRDRFTTEMISAMKLFNQFDQAEGIQRQINCSDPCRTLTKAGG